ncbi:MAG: hypothetical protein R6U57_12645 [Anaerolineales bacterium]
MGQGLFGGKKAYHKGNSRPQASGKGVELSATGRMIICQGRGGWAGEGVVVGGVDGLPAQSARRRAIRQGKALRVDRIMVAPGGDFV